MMAVQAVQRLDLGTQTLQLREECPSTLSKVDGVAQSTFEKEIRAVVVEKHQTIILAKRECERFMQALVEAILLTGPRDINKDQTKELSATSLVEKYKQQERNEIEGVMKYTEKHSKGSQKIIRYTQTFKLFQQFIANAEIDYAKRARMIQRHFEKKEISYFIDPELSMLRKELQKVLESTIELLQKRELLARDHGEKVIGIHDANLKYFEKLSSATLSDNELVTYQSHEDFFASQLLIERYNKTVIEGDMSRGILSPAQIVRVSSYIIKEMEERHREKASDFTNKICELESRQLNLYDQITDIEFDEFSREVL